LEREKNNNLELERQRLSAEEENARQKERSRQIEREKNMITRELSQKENENEYLRYKFSAVNMEMQRAVQERQMKEKQLAEQEEQMRQRRASEEHLQNNVQDVTNNNAHDDVPNSPVRGRHGLYEPDEVDGGSSAAHDLQVMPDARLPEYDRYVIRWSYSVKASGIRSLKGGESKRDTTGRDQIAYFFWHGRDCSASGKGTSALATIELDSDKSPQIMVDEGHESACFLNMFDGQMIVHHGKLDEAKSIEEDNVLMYCVHHDDEREISLTQVEARSSNLRSRSSFVVVVIDEAVGICVWHGAKSTKEKKQGALRGAKRLANWFQGMFEINKVDMVEVEEGHEGGLFWKALDGKNDYGSLQEVSGKCDNRVRLFTFLSTEGPFLAREILNPTRGEHVSPYPFRQANLYDATQPALFLIDAVHEMYLWQGWWPGNPEESESATTTGSAEFRWHRDRKLAMQSVQSYADSVGRQMSKACVVNAGLEPTEFRSLFPFWEDHPDVTKINLESAKLNGKKESMTELLAKLSRDRYSLAELLVRPLPEGVDPLKMEMYLSDEEFKEVFNMTKDEFNKLPKWKKLEQRKKAGLF
ncbi:supervillin isoform X5, partial [Paramuricea clavata]